jgi:hypothetical protein
MSPLEHLNTGLQEIGGITLDGHPGLRSCWSEHGEDRRPIASFPLFDTPQNEADCRSEYN